MTTLKLITRRWRYQNPRIINEQTIVLENDDNYVEDIEIEVYGYHDDFPEKIITIDSTGNVNVEKKERVVTK